MGILNIGEACTGLQCRNGLSEKVALRLIDPDLKRTDYTFTDLEIESNRFANALVSLGVKRQERVFIFLPKQPEVFFAFLGALKCRQSSVFCSQILAKKRYLSAWQTPKPGCSLQNKAFSTN
jgi:acyl-coenzyme A synthetase/AMP-(fatty) acid ligase